MSKEERFGRLSVCTTSFAGVTSVVVTLEMKRMSTYLCGCTCDMVIILASLNRIIRKESWLFPRGIEVMLKK